MEKSALQIARAAYQPKLPAGLRGNVKIVEGAPTQSVDNQEGICSHQHRYHPLWWSSSWRSQRDLRSL